MGGLYHPSHLFFSIDGLVVNCVVDVEVILVAGGQGKVETHWS